MASYLNFQSEAHLPPPLHFESFLIVYFEVGYFEATRDSIISHLIFLPLYTHAILILSFSPHSCRPYL